MIGRSMVFMMHLISWQTAIEKEIWALWLLLR